MAREETMNYRRALDVLGLEDGVGLDDINKAYKTLAKLYHPDKNQSEDTTAKFQEISVAYRVLKSHVTGADFDDEIDNEDLFFFFLQATVYFRRFQNLARFHTFNSSDYSNRYDRKSKIFEVDEDNKFFEFLLKKKKSECDNIDELNPDEVVKKYKSYQEWEQSKKRSKKNQFRMAPFPRPLSKKKQQQQQAKRESEIRKIRAEIIKQNQVLEKREKARKEKLKKAKEKKNDLFISNQLVNEETVNSSYATVNTQPTMKSTKKVKKIKVNQKIESTADAKVLDSKKTVDEKPLEKSKQMENKVSAYEELLKRRRERERMQNILDEQQIAAEQQNKRKSELKLKRDMSLKENDNSSTFLLEKEENPEIVSAPVPNAWLQGSPSCFKKASLPGPTEHLTPTCEKEEQEMLTKAIELSIKEEQEKQEALLRSFEQEKKSNERNLDPFHLGDN